MSADVGVRDPLQLRGKLTNSAHQGKHKAPRPVKLLPVPRDAERADVPGERAEVAFASRRLYSEPGRRTRGLGLQSDRSSSVRRYRCRPSLSEDAASV